MSDVRNLDRHLRERLPGRGWRVNGFSDVGYRWATWVVESTIPPKGFRVNLNLSLGEGDVVLRLELSLPRPRRNESQRAEEVVVPVSRSASANAGVAAILSALRGLRNPPALPGAASGDSERPVW